MSIEKHDDGVVEYTFRITVSGGGDTCRGGRLNAYIYKKTRYQVANSDGSIPYTICKKVMRNSLPYSIDNMKKLHEWAVRKCAELLEEDATPEPYEVPACTGTDDELNEEEDEQ